MFVVQEGGVRLDLGAIRIRVLNVGHWTFPGVARRGLDRRLDPVWIPFLGWWLLMVSHNASHFGAARHKSGPYVSVWRRRRVREASGKRLSRAVWKNNRLPLFQASASTLHLQGVGIQAIKTLLTGTHRRYLVLVATNCPFAVPCSEQVTRAKSGGTFEARGE